ncbi:MAG: hypothetical protein CL608_17725 [Anaerolineaceae bacterium]|nr:hypothetical protein [Anaerolineaceae bacterium]
MKRLYWLSVILILLLAACAGPAAVEPAAESGGVEETATSASSVQAVPTADSDTVTYTDDEAGFSIALPASWTTVEASTEAFTEMRRAVGEDESFTFLTDEYVQALLESGLQLYALHEETASLTSELPVSLKIIRRDAPTSMSLDEYVTSTATQFESILELTMPIEQSTVMLGGDEAIQLRYAMQTQTAVGTKAEVHNTQYYLINGSDLYIITLEMGQDLVDDYLVVGETAVETFQLNSGG